MFFSKKKRLPEEPKKCNHKWKDFPWYLSIVDLGPYETYRYAIRVKEPYVCIKCKERIDKQLAVHYNKSVAGCREMEEELYKMYDGRLLHIEEVEDMVNDECLVDREYLKYADELLHPSGEFDGVDLFMAVERAKEKLTQGTG